MALKEDPRVFLADFGKDVTLTPTSGASKRTRGLYDAAYSAGAGMGSAAPQILVPSLDVPANITRGTASVEGVGTFTVASPESDGSGWTTLILEAA